MKKRKHHYVWKEYLQSWSKDGKIFCLRKGKLFNTSLENIAQERDFYKLKELTKHDMNIIYELGIKNITNPQLKKLNENWIHSFSKIFLIKESLIQNNISEKELDVIIDENIHNLEENLHENIEKNGYKFLKKLLNEDTEFFNDDSNDFMHFLWTQYFRTKKRQVAAIESTKDYSDIDIEKIWNVLSHIYTTSATWHFNDNIKDYKLVLLKNNSDVEFITADQPIINTHSYRNSSLTEEFEFYYPISPVSAVLITKKIHNDKYDTCVDSVQATLYNDMMSEQSYEQIFASSEKAIPCRLNLEDVN